MALESEGAPVDPPRGSPVSSKVIFAFVVIAVVGLAIAAFGLYSCATEPPDQRALRVADVRANRDDPDFAEVCFGSGTGCYEVFADEAASFGPVGGCVLVEFVGEGPIRAVELLGSSGCGS
jgi:hypothetical protein